MYIPSIIKPYLVGIVHSISTVLGVYIVLLAALFSGLAFVLELSNSTALFLVVIVVSVTIVVTFCMRKLIQKTGSVSRVVLAASTVSLFAIAKIMLVQYYATYSVSEVFVGVLPVIFYIVTLIGSAQWFLRK